MILLKLPFWDALKELHDLENTLDAFGLTDYFSYVMIFLCVSLFILVLIFLIIFSSINILKYFLKSNK